MGRTGSGKSSLIVSLFRIVEPYAGAIYLDGLNLVQLGLDDVRGRIAAIPQVSSPGMHAGIPMATHCSAAGVVNRALKSTCYTLQPA